MLRCLTDPFSSCCKRFTKSLPNCSLCNFKNAVNVSEVELDLDYLDDVRYLDTVVFAPPITAGKVIKVYDGDTITIASKLPNSDAPIYRFSVRLLGIDSAEIKGKTFAEKEIAVKARDSRAGEGPSVASRRRPACRSRAACRWRRRWTVQK